MKKTSIKLGLLLALVMPMGGCFKDLNRKPLTDITSANLFEDFSNYKGVLAKLYAGLSTTGQKGPSGDKDINAVDDEGVSSYLRMLWTLQDMTTDVAKCQWNDPGIPSINTGDFGSENPFIKGMYYRLYFQISLCNEFLRELTDSRLASRNITGANLATAKQYKAETRFLRALAYYHALDLFGGKIPFITEETKASELPMPTNVNALYAFIESELKAAEGEMLQPNIDANSYGRANKAAAWMLLSKLYLNANTYIKTPNYAGASEYAKKVIDANIYSLETNYEDLFKADNHNSKEIIFSANFDGINTRSYGGSTFLAHACVGGKMNPEAYGVDGGWGGMRATKQFVSLFPSATPDIDKRALFFTDGQNLEMDKLTGKFEDGYGLAKFKNVTKSGAVGKDLVFVDVDFPIFRLAEAYLNYAEAYKVGGAGDGSLALQYFNKVRNRAYNDVIGEVDDATMTSDYILSERGRELYHECTRRTDLRRFNLYTGSAYNWAWKGGVKDGASLSGYKEIFPIPVDDLIANKNLTQNLGY